MVNGPHFTRQLIFRLLVNNSFMNEYAQLNSTQALYSKFTAGMNNDAEVRSTIVLQNYIDRSCIPPKSEMHETVI